VRAPHTAHLPKRRRPTRARRAWPRMVALVLAVVALVALAVAALPVAPARAASEPAPLWEYQSRVEGAYDAVEAAAMVEMTDLAASELAADINTLLPATEQVEMDDGTVLVVDNSILRSLVSRLAALETPHQRREVVSEMRRHLASLRQAVSGDPGHIPADPEALQELIDAQAAPTRSPLAEFFGDLLEWLLERLQVWWERAGANPTASTIMTWVTVGIAAALTAGLAFLLVRVLLRSMAARARPDTLLAPVPIGPADAPPAAEPPADPLAAADALAAEGRLTAAVRMLLSGAARMLAQAGVLRQTKTRTNGELLAQVRADAAVREPLTELAYTFDRAYYGHREPDRGAYDAARGSYRKLARIVERRTLGEEGPSEPDGPAQGGDAA